MFAGKIHELISNLYGPFTIDRFIDNSNHKVSPYQSNCYHPGVSDVTAFNVNEIGEENWLYPPVSCIGSINQI